jgi:hypothetical protein
LEDEDTKMPEQSRVTAQIMRNLGQHKAIEDRQPSTRCEEMLRLHQNQVFDAISHTEEGGPQSPSEGHA